MKQLIVNKNELEASNPNLSIIGVFNPAITRYKNEIIMIARVAEAAKQDDDFHYLVPKITEENEIQVIKLPKDNPNYDYSDIRVVKNHDKQYLTSMSHFRIGRSSDGLYFVFSKNEVIFPSGKYEEYGIEDPRITLIDAKYYITYTGVSSYGTHVRLMETEDFIKFNKLGTIFSPDNKDCVIFPKKINGKYYSFHRPNKMQHGKLDIWIAESQDLLNWKNHSIFSDARIDFCESIRVGAGSTPILTDKGWLEIYHTADTENRYALVCMLVSKDNPSRIIMKSKEPLITPTEPYEKFGFMQNVVFTCGHLINQDEIYIYYGVCDENIAVCKMSLDNIWNNMEEINNA
jgi:predicted GH43/DUF377 family glycosyl hydrolase